MNQPSLAPAGSAPAGSPASRIIRTVVVTVLALASSFLLLLALVATVPLVRESIKPLVSEQPIVSVTAAVAVLLVVLLLPLWVLGRLARRGLLRWPQLTAFGALIAAAFVYLVWDDPVVRRPLTMDEFSPPLPGDEATHQLVLRYAKGSPAANAYRPPAKSVVALVGPREGEKWAAHLRTHRAAIEAGWAGLADVRAWWDELARQPRLGDLTEPRPITPILAFQPVRSYSQHAVAIASLQALDGKGDEAAATVLRVYDVARKLEPASRTLVRTMIAKVIQRMAIDATGFILDRATVSPSSRAALAEALAAAAGGPAGARRLTLIEYAYFQPYLTLYLQQPLDSRDPTDRFLHAALWRLGRLVVNPRATQNYVGERYYALATCAEERRLTDFDASTQALDRDFLGGYHLKNVGGRMIAGMAMPAMSKVVKTYWEIEDARLALIKRLKA